MDDRLYTQSQASDLLALAAKLEASAAEASHGRLSLEELKEAARSAGIDPRWVEAAARTSTHLSEPAKPFMGIPIASERSLVVPGHVDDALWGRMLREIRGALGDGEAETVGEVRRWKKQRNTVTLETVGPDTLVQISIDWSANAKSLVWFAIASLITASMMAGLSYLTAEAALAGFSALFVALSAIYGCIAWFGYHRKFRKSSDSLDQLSARLQRLAPGAAVAQGQSESASLQQPEIEQVIEPALALEGAEDETQSVQPANPQTRNRA